MVLSISSMRIFLSLCILAALSATEAFAPLSPSSLSGKKRTGTTLYSAPAYEAPSDYDTADLAPDERVVAVDTDEDDAAIRDALIRELLVIAGVTNRGEYASNEERDIVVDLVTQLEALNPTAEPASNCQGDWDLCLSSTQFFRSSPFFLSIRAALGDDNKAVAENGFDIHDRATTASRIGRVRQTITDDELVSEVDLEVGMLPGFPFRAKGTVVTTSTLDVTCEETWELRIKGTKVNRSNVPFLNKFLDDANLEVPVGDLYSTILQSVPVFNLKTYYVDQGIRITRDIDDNFFVFSRA